MSGRTRTFYCPDDLWDDMSCQAELEGVSRNAWVARALRDQLDAVRALTRAEDRLLRVGDPVPAEGFASGEVVVAVGSRDGVPAVRRPVRPFSKSDQAKGRR